MFENGFLPKSESLQGLNKDYTILERVKDQKGTACRKKPLLNVLANCRMENKIMLRFLSHPSRDKLAEAFIVYYGAD